jgi:hypothetical protein
MGECMTDDQIVVMLSEIVEALDYDLWKDVFFYGGTGLPIPSDELEDLVEIVRSHVR